MMSLIFCCWLRYRDFTQEKLTSGSLGSERFVGLIRLDR